jgi:acetyl-CoA acetyltransferase
MSEFKTRKAYIVDCCRTATGKRNGALSQWHSADLGAKVVDELLDRTGLTGDLVDDGVFVCVCVCVCVCVSVCV